MNFCPECQGEYSDELRFCPKDGAVLSQRACSIDTFIDKTVGGKYKILERIGEGGMGTVYKAEHVLLKHVVAVKILRSHIAQDEECLRRFQREARTACRINHPNAITLHDFGVEDGAPYLVMEYIEGRTLRQLIRDERPLAIERSIRITCHAAAALCEAHSYGIVHRDLKPENIMISMKRDGTEWVHVLDFGIAKVLTPDNDQDVLTQTRTGAIFGSPKYMAPEQALSRPIDARTDIYALGVVLYEMLSGEVPFQGSSTVEMMYKICHETPKSLAELGPELAIPDAVNEIVFKMLARDPAERYQSLKDFLKDCESIFAEQQQPAKSSSRTTHILLAVTSLTLVALIAVSLLRNPKNSATSLEQIRKLEALQQEKEAEIRDSARLAEEKKKEAEIAAAEADRLRQQQAELQKMTEEQKRLAMEALKEAEGFRQLRIKEEERATLLKGQAAEAEKLAKQQKEEAEKAALQALAQRREAEEAAERLKQEALIATQAEEQRVLALKSQAEAAALAAEQKKAQAEIAAEVASRQKAEAEAATTLAEEERKKAEAKQKAAEALSLEAEKDKVAAKSETAIGTPGSAARTPVQLEQAYQEAEQKRLKALQEAKLLEEQKRKAEAKLKALQAAQQTEAARLEQIRKAAAQRATTTIAPEETETEAEEQPTRRLPRQGKKR